MLLEFHVTNFRSFKERQTLSLLASNDRSLPENLVVANERTPRMLRSAVLYGPNASGKSNLILALSFVKQAITMAATQVPGIEPGKAPFIRRQPFQFDATTRHAPTAFEVVILVDQVRYQYGFRLDQERFLEEWLFAFPKGQPQRLFARTYDADTQEYSWSFSARLSGEKQRIRSATHERTLFLAMAAVFRHEQLLPVFRWFTETLQVIPDPLGMDALMTRYTALHAMENPHFYERVRRMLSYADFGITAFQAHEKPVDERIFEGLPPQLRQALLNDTMQQLEIIMQHGDDRESILSKEEESLGTQRFFTLIGPWIDAIDQGMVLALDELDASLHPALTRYLVELFHDPEISRRGAQVIFSTHDVTLLDTTLFRRDQIWFTERTREGASQLIPLSDFSPRKAESLMRGYLSGRYGAVPFLTRLTPDLFMAEAEQEPAGA